jgi:DUF971 family protein
MISAKPSEIKRNDSKGITITWQDGITSAITAALLRSSCPCAACKEKRGDTSHAKPLTAKKRSLTIVEASLDQELDLKEIWGIGNYAIGLRWGDGHDSGIYTFEYLRELSGQVM